MAWPVDDAIGSGGTPLIRVRSAGGGRVTGPTALGFERVAQHRTVRQLLEVLVADRCDDNTYPPHSDQLQLT